MMRHYPRWSVTRSLDRIFDELVDSWQARLQAAGGVTMVASGA
jgi:hypothetical protein